MLSSIFGQNQEARGQEEEEDSSTAEVAPMAAARQPQHQVVVPQQHQRGGGVPLGKQKALAGADGKNRHVLGDIGNVVNHQAIDGKLQPPINRPVTRSCGAKPLANAPGGANKKSAAFAVGRPGKGCEKACKQKVRIKTKTVEVIVISPDKDEEMKKVSVGKTISTHSSSLRKTKVHTLTSVLTARSKAACGITDRPKDSVPDIDALDHNNQLAVTDYVEDIYKFYKLSEHSIRPRDYMNWQMEITANLRSILADWLIEVHLKFRLMPETLYLTFHIIDCYLSLETVLRRELQLVGVSAMLIASKYEELWAPEVNDFISISGRACSREKILAMEKGILNKLEWNLTVPTIYVFLVRFVKAALCDKEMEHMVFFFAELGLLQYSVIMYCPSMVAAAAVYAARCTLKKIPLWTKTLEHHTGLSEPQILDCAQILVNSHSAAPESKLKAVYKKYSGGEFGAVALNTPAIKVFEDMKAT